MSCTRSQVWLSVIRVPGSERFVDQTIAGLLGFPWVFDGSGRPGSVAVISDRVR